MERILPAVNASQTKYQTRKKTRLLSEIFTVTDEAFGIMLLENYEERWNKQYLESDKTKWRNKDMNAKYTSSKNGVKTNTWSTEGRNKFCDWCKRVEILRKEESTGKQVEHELLLLHNPEGKDVEDIESSAATVETDADVYVDSAYASLFGDVSDEAAV